MAQRNALLLVLLFLSGAAGLVYETVWLYLFKTVAGGTLFALSVTLFSFMAGLALGGFAGARLRVSRFHPAKLFGLVEIALAVSVWICFAAFEGLRGFLPPIYKTVVAGVFDYFLRFVYCGLLALPVPFLMGLSFPPAVAALSQGRPGSGAPSGAAYFANTLGGAAGTAVAGFFLLEKAGIVLTLVSASALDLGAGLAAAALFPGAPLIAGGKEAPPRAHDRVNRGNLGLAVAYGLFGFTVMGCEILWMRILELRFLSTAYGFSLTLGLLLAGIALGGLLFRETMDGRPEPLLHTLFFAGLALFGALIPLSGFLLFRIPMPFAAFSFLDLLFAQWLIAGTAIFAPAVLSGFLFPLAVRLADPEAPAARRSAGTLYAANAIGAALAALFTPHLLIGRFGLSGGLFALALCCGTVLPLVFLCAKGIDGGMRRSRVPLAVLPLFTLVPLWRHTFNTLDASKKEYPVFFREGASATVNVVEFGDLPYRELKVNGVRTEGGTSPEALVSQRLQLSLPLSLRGRARDVLVLGLGTGISLGAVADFPLVRRAECAEISPDIAFAAAYFDKENRRVLSDPRVRLHLNDARLFVSAVTARYDCITGDLFFPWMQGSGLLYTREHFEACRKRLAAGGLFCQWLPLYQLSYGNFRIIANAFAAAFPGAELWMGHFSADKPTAALVGLADPADAVHPPDSLLPRFVCVIAQDSAFPQERDLAPKTEFLASRGFFTQQQSNADFSGFFEEQYRKSGRGYLAGLFNAFRLYQEGDPAEALRSLDSLSALDSLLPHAEFLLPQLCRFVHDGKRSDLTPAALRLLQRVTARYRDDFQLFGFLGKFLLLDKRYAEALEACRAAVALNPRDEQALLNQGVCYAMTGNDQLAVKSWKKVLVLNPRSMEASYNIRVNEERTPRPASSSPPPAPAPLPKGAGSGIVR